MPEAVDYRWRAAISDAEVNGLTRSYGGAAEDGWWDRIRPHSLGWATAHRPDGIPVGFANVAWDGGDHAFLLDPKVHVEHRHRGIGTALVRLAARQAAAAGCEWLHVDFGDELAAFYFDACGFAPTAAGVLRLVPPD
jgi:ribosomal protein S18 acetylase RimI-like enzyme